MINDLRLGFKMMRYGHSAKLSFIGCIVMVVFGIIFSVVCIMVEHSLPGGYFLIMAGLLLLQLLFSVNAASLVQTSPMKKKLQTSVPAVLSVTLMVLGYLLSVVTVGVISCSQPEMMSVGCTQLIITAVCMGIVMLYYGACYKYFMVSTIIFFSVFVIFYPSAINGSWRWGIMPFAGIWKNFALTAVIGLAIILVCGVLEYLLSLAVYKAPISKMALGANLRRQL